MTSKYYYDIEQGSPEWYAIRAGKFGASKCLDLFAAKTTSKYQNLINNIVYERLTGKTIEGYKNEAMQRGNDLEEEARQEFEFITGNSVETVGYVIMDKWIGCSPDGLIGDDELLEIKCPLHTTQIAYLAKKEVPKQYYYQIQFQIMVTGRKYCWFFSYHPDLPEVIIKVERDIELIKEIKDKLKTAKREATEILRRIK